MPTDDVRKKLLAEYAVALVEERASWERLSDPLLSGNERCHILAKWKPAADRLKTLVTELRHATAPAAAPIQEPSHPACGSR